MNEKDKESKIIITKWMNKWLRGGMISFSHFCFKASYQSNQIEHVPATVRFLASFWNDLQ